MSICSAIDDRVSLLHDWLSGLFPGVSLTVLPLAGDASFRRYFRLRAEKQDFIVMDAPPEKENCDAFIAIANAFQNTSARFPRVFAANLSLGFLLLSDFGDQQLQPLLNAQSVDELYRSAMDVLLQIQHCSHIPHYDLPHFSSELFWREFEILDTWYIKKNLSKTLSQSDATQLKAIYELLINSALSQPQVFVHRDYHSRNIMLCADGVLGILDFQDAVMGPITYDLVSLLRDCYVAWPQARVEAWVNYFYELLQKDRQLESIELETVMRWFDWMGLQRHLKCLGIFSRLHYRDGKNGYLKEIPRVLDYVLSVCDRYPELHALRNILLNKERQ